MGDLLKEKSTQDILFAYDWAEFNVRSEVTNLRELRSVLKQRFKDTENPTVELVDWAKRTDKLGMAEINNLFYGVGVAESPGPELDDYANKHG